MTSTSLLPRNSLIEGDCLAVMRRFPPTSVDLVVTDPPYNIASDHAFTRRDGRILTTAEAWGAWDHYDDHGYRRLLANLFRQLGRVLRPAGQLYIWLGARYLSTAIEYGEAAGFRFRAKLVAVKARPQPSLTRGNYRSAYEECLYFSKGRPSPFHFLGQPKMTNVLDLPYEQKATAHPTEKRPAMIAPLIEVSSDPGELVLDPFLGSGTTAAVARALGRDYIGIEREARYLAMARERLRAV